MTCALCGGACRDADLPALLDTPLTWLWEQVAATADRRGDPDLTTGLIRITAPAAPEHRAAAVGLLGGRPLAAGQTRQVDLSSLTARLRGRGANLTPGAVAAHATRRPLAAKARARAERADREAALQAALIAALATAPRSSERLPTLSGDAAWAHLRRSGWVARLNALPHPEQLLRTAVAVVTHLPTPGARTDRRRLANDHAHDPHALDDGAPLAGLTLALTTAAGATSAGQRARAAWDSLGVDWDDLTGGLITIGIHPVGWTLPPHVAVTIPPRELAGCRWPAPAGPGAVFVTENPSVAAAAADLVAADGTPVRLICTSGTPSAGEVAALARLAAAGWPVRVRADFDPAGLTHVATLLGAVPGATPWRMGTADYLASLPRPPAVRVALDPRKVPGSPWDPALARTMRTHAAAAYEEALLPELLADLRSSCTS
ncbi:DUF2399 domain-containing protein [Geodermatophilus sp. URMC 62]|uniref:DUF2399 domain-containing protein n=1 Tax=Geodermatophilus sp. URMC 62 TaxID=3423414 RepID=UPI00406BE4D1